MASRRITINTLTGGGARLIGMLVGFVTTPLLVHDLGDSGFGLFVLVGAIVGYVGLLDFGIGPGLVRHFTECDETGDTRGVEQIMTLAVTFYLVMGLVVGGLLFVSVPWIVGWLKVSEALRKTAEISVVIVFGYFILSCLVGILTARLISLHRMDLTSLITLVGQVAYAGLVILVLPRAPTVETAILLNVAQAGLVGGMALVLLLRVKAISFCNPLTIPLPLVRKLSAFGGWMQVNSLASLISLETDKIVVAAFTGIQSVTSYQIGNRLGTLGRVFPLQLLGAATPRATALSLGNDPEALKRFYIEITRYLMLLTLPITGFTAVIATPFIVAWMGRPFPNAVFVAIGLSVAFAINNLTGVGTTILRGAGQPKYETYAGIVGVVLNIGLTIILARPYGLVGIVTGTIVAEVITSVYFIIIFHRKYAFGWWETVGDWLWRLTLAICLAVGVVEVVQHFIHVMPTNRLEGVLQIMAYGVVFSSVFLISITAFGFWTRDDRDAAGKVLKRFRLVRSAT
jgi:O-antigen/teichoic acid export membrane protein